jgi:transcriptional regulator NrdR family protein
MMRCPVCTNETKVKNTREKTGGDMHRRRECESCGYRFSTTETPNSVLDLERLRESSNTSVRGLLERAIRMIKSDDQQSNSNNPEPAA